MLSTGTAKMGQAGGKKGEVQIYFQCILLCALNTGKNIFFDNLKGSYCFEGEYIYVYIPTYFPFPSFWNPEKFELRLTGKNLAKSEAKSL